MSELPKALALSRPGMTELIAWIVGLAAFSNLVVEIFGQFDRSNDAGFVLSFLLLYVVYLSFSVPMFWKARRIIIPTTLFINSTLWTLALQFSSQASLVWSYISLLAVPLLTAFLVAKFLPEPADTDGSTDLDDSPSPIHVLLARGKRLGHRSAVVKPPGLPEL